jgi:hypothetical protein
VKVGDSSSWYGSGIESFSLCQIHQPIAALTRTQESSSKRVVASSNVNEAIVDLVLRKGSLHICSRRRRPSKPSHGDEKEGQEEEREGDVNERVHR